MHLEYKLISSADRMSILLFNLQLSILLNPHNMPYFYIEKF